MPSLFVSCVRQVMRRMPDSSCGSPGPGVCWHSWIKAGRATDNQGRRGGGEGEGVGEERDKEKKKIKKVVPVLV